MPSCPIAAAVLLDGELEQPASVTVSRWMQTKQLVRGASDQQAGGPSEQEPPQPRASRLGITIGSLGAFFGRHSLEVGDALVLHSQGSCRMGVLVHKSGSQVGCQPL